MLVACVVFYWMNVLTPFKEDDMELSLLRDAGFTEFWRAQLDHYLTTNGRCSDFFATLFCAYLGKPLFNIVNTLVFGVMAHLISLLSTGRRSMTVLALFIAVIASCFPVPGQTMLFLAGSCNYMWAITASMLVILILQRHNVKRPGKWKTAGILLLALLAGNFNEATSLGFFAGLVFYYFFNRDRLDRLTVMALAAYLIGALLIVASPAAWNRAAGADFVVDMGLKDLLYSRSVIFIQKGLRFITPVAAVIIGLLALLLRRGKAVRQCVWTYILIGVAAAMFALGQLNERPYASLTTAGLIIVSMTIHHLLADKQWLRLAVIAACLAVSVFTGTHAMQALIDYKAYEDRTMSEIAAAPRQAILRERRFDRENRFVTALRYVSSEYFVRENIYCAYYDKDNVQFVSDSVYDRYYTGRLLDGAEVMPWTSDRPDLIGNLLSFPNQDYLVAELRIDNLPFTSQQARYYNASEGEVLTEKEIAFRRRYGLTTDYTPCGFYPLHYQGILLLIFPIPNEGISHVVFPIDDNLPPGEVSLTKVQATDERQ